MENLSLHVLDIAENSIRAGASEIAISICVDEDEDRLTLIITDDGQGMDAAMKQEAMNPFFTTKGGKKVGLGLALLAQASRETGRELTIESEPGQGTTVTAEFKLSHPDMRPLGDMLETIAVLVAGNPEIRFVYDYRKGDRVDHFDSGETEAQDN